MRGLGINDLYIDYSLRQPGLITHSEKSSPKQNTFRDISHFKEKVNEMY
jgi:hypothetical protein